MRNTVLMCFFMSCELVSAVFIRLGIINSCSLNTLTLVKKKKAKKKTSLSCAISVFLQESFRPEESVGGRRRRRKKKEEEEVLFGCRVEAVLVVHALHHITGLGLSSLWAAGLAMATTTSGIRHFIRPPISAASWLCSISKRAANLPTRCWHSLISDQPDTPNTYRGGKKEEKIPL